MKPKLTYRSGVSACFAIVPGRLAIALTHCWALGRFSSRKGLVFPSLFGHWLSQRDEVFAYCSARAYDGGTGAIYVLFMPK